MRPSYRFRGHAGCRSGGWPTVIAAIVLGCWTVTACRDTTAPIAYARTRIRPEWVTGQAAAAVDPVTGLIRLDLPAGKYVGVLSADSVALGVLHLLRSPSPLNSAPAELESDRGGTIDFAALGLCGHVTYEWSPIAPYPASIPSSIARSLSSQWAIPLCGPHGDAQVSVGVSDSPREFTVADDTLQIPNSENLSGAVGYTGVPARYPSGLPITPEEAIEVVYQVTRHPVASVPAAYDQSSDTGVGQLPLCASWRLSIDTSVTVRSERTGATWSTAEFFVHHVPACFADTTAAFAADPVQPESLWVTTSAGGDSALLALDGPVKFDRVVVISR